MSTRTPELLDVSSPAAAIGRQAAREARLTTLAERMMEGFLGRMVELAYDGALSPVTVSSTWNTRVQGLLDQLTTEEAAYVGQDFFNTDIPDDAYTSAVAVLTAHAQAYGSVNNDRTALRTELQKVFSADSFAVEQISASASWSGGSEERFLELHGSMVDLARAEQLGLVAAGFWDSLKDTGSVWIRRIRRVSRTSATGMSGWITVTAIRLQDYPNKRWVTRHDDRVRHTHRLADGQTVPVDQPFRVGTASLMYPGERDAVYGEIVSCRCVLIGVR